MQFVQNLNVKFKHLTAHLTRILHCQSVNSRTFVVTPPHHPLNPCILNNSTISFQFHILQMFRSFFYFCCAHSMRKCIERHHRRLSQLWQLFAHTLHWRRGTAIPGRCPIEFVQHDTDFLYCIWAFDSFLWPCYKGEIIMMMHSVFGIRFFINYSSI